MALSDQERKRLAADCRAIFDTPQGERVLEYLSGFCFEHRLCSKHVKPSSTPMLQTYFNEGRRSVLLRLRQFLSTKPERKGDE